jgi:hypothetical protein
MYYRWMHVIQMPLSERTGTLIKVTSPRSWAFHCVVYTALFMTTWTTENCMLGVKEPHSQSKSLSCKTLIHLTCYTDQGDQFLQCCVNGGWNMSYLWTPKTKRHVDGKTPIVSPSTGIQSEAISKKEHGNSWQLSFGAIKVCFLCMFWTLVML